MITLTSEEFLEQKRTYPEGEIIIVLPPKEDPSQKFFETYSVRIKDQWFQNKIWISPDVQDSWAKHIRKKAITALKITLFNGWFVTDDAILECVYCQRRISTTAHEKGHFLYKLPCTCRPVDVGSPHERSESNDQQRTD